ncbi:helix-turn-helix domain-containing protein [Streptomyces sp. NPDC059071]|uniref:helix-turn-helix domain-containing protein n=1 Tax=unclassified Streptomyces TaxID=2593676 RepID=UPI0036541F33
MAVSKTLPALPDLDLVTYKEAGALFEQTGHGVSERTMRRWVHSKRIATAKVRGIVYVSFSDLLVAHGDWVAGVP